MGLPCCLIELKEDELRENDSYSTSIRGTTHGGQHYQKSHTLHGYCLQPALACDYPWWATLSKTTHISRKVLATTISLRLPMVCNIIENHARHMESACDHPQHAITPHVCFNVLCCLLNVVAY